MVRKKKVSGRGGSGSMSEFIDTQITHLKTDRGTQKERGVEDSL